MASSWNRNPAAFREKVLPSVETKDAVQLLFYYSTGAAVSAILPSFGSMMSMLLGVGSRSLFTFLLSKSCWCFSIVCVVRACNTFYLWRSTKVQVVAQNKLEAGQRKLFGLAPPAPKVEGVRQRKPLPPPASSAPAMSPPQRWTPLVPSATPTESVGRALPDMGTPMSASTGRPSRGMYNSGSTIATPEQLQFYLDRVGSGAATPGGGAPDVTSPAPHMWRDYAPSMTTTPMAPTTTSRSPGGSVSPQVSAEESGYGGQHQQQFSFQGPTSQQAEPSEFPVLPVGSEAPKYRPSWLPRVKTVVHTPDVLTLSSDEEINEVVSRLLGVVRRDWMEVWTENLREWFSKQLLGPLVNQVFTAHEAVNKVLQKYGQDHKLPPIPDVTSPLSGPTHPSEDMEALVRHIQQWCTALSQSVGNNPNTPQGADAQELAKALTKYDQLILMLRGKRPADLLPPAPAGYMWSRIQELAHGTCMPDYKWNSGGMWAGRPWSADLPTDSLVMLYLFAAFLDAPGWEFSAKSSDMPSVGMPLYLGQLKSRPPNRYSAILSYRPEKPSKDVAAILALNMASSASGGNGGPMLCFLVEGRILALAGYQALFHVVLFFVLYHKQLCNSTIGNHYLHDKALDLAAVVKPPKARNAQGVHSVFGWWFPATHNTEPEDANMMTFSNMSPAHM